MDSDRLLTCHDFADATGATGLRRAVILALTGMQLTFGQWRETLDHGIRIEAVPRAQVGADPELRPIPALTATPPSRPRRRRTPKATAASTGAPA